MNNAALTPNQPADDALPLNAMAIAMGLHVRVGIEDNLWGRKGERMTFVQQVEQMVRLSREMHREVAPGKSGVGAGTHVQPFGRKPHYVARTPGVITTVSKRGVPPISIQCRTLN